MTERTRAWRWSDLIGVVGLILILMGAPAMAEATQEDTGFVGAYRFDTPLPRVGDHIEYDLVLQVAGEPPRVIPGILTIDRFVPAPDEAPVDVAFAERRIFAGLDIQQAGLEVRMEPETVVEYHDRHGYRMHDQNTWRQTSDDPNQTVLVQHSSVVAGRFGTFDNGRFGFPYVYGPDFRADLLGETHTSGPGEPWLKTLRYHLEYRGNDFYGAHHGSRSAALHALSDAWEGAPEENRPCVLERVHMFHPGFAPRLQVRWDHGGTDCRPTAATLYSPDNAGFSGTHEDLVRNGTIIASMSLLPGIIHKGPGPVIPMQDNYRYGGRSSFMGLQPPPDPAVPLVTLGELDRSDRPLLREVGFDDLRALMQAPDAPTELREAMDAGAVITGFQWVPDPAPRGAEWATAPLPDELAGLAGAASEPGHDTLWYLALTRPDGYTTAATLSVHDTSDGALVRANAYRVCAEADPKCGARMLDASVLRAKVADPHAILDRARAAIAMQQAWAETPDPVHFEYAAGAPASNLTRQSALPRAWTGWVEIEPHWMHAPYRPTPAKGVGFASWSMHPPSWFGHAENDSPGPATSGYTGSIELTTGIDWWRTHWSPAEPATDPGPGITSSNEAVRLVQPPSMTSAVLGLSLFVGAAIARLWAALAAGFHFPVVAWLYAKVRNADVLLHERRAAIVQAIATQGGMTASEVAKRLGYGWGSTVHHLQRLVQAGLLRAVVDGPHRFYVPADGPDATGRGTIARQRLLAAIEAHPGATAAELAKIVDRRRASVSRLAARLVDAKLVRRERDGRKVRFHPQASGHG